MSQTILAPLGQDDWRGADGKLLWKPTAFPNWLGEGSETVARRLLGCYLVRDLALPSEGPISGSSPSFPLDSQNNAFRRVRVVVRIVETEAYDQDDPASHAYHGKTRRNRTLFGPPGHCYIYFTYGMWHCLNISCSADGYGAGALIRAVQPVVGGDLLEERRGKRLMPSGAPARLSHRVGALDGPARLTTALDIDQRLYGHDLRRPPLQLMEGTLRPGEHIEETIRIGITRAVERKRRYFIAGNPWVSKMPSKTRKQEADLKKAFHKE